jgi:DNA repair exonuclease SbcCD ATPase subunit
MTRAQLRKIEIHGFRSFGIGKQTFELPSTVAVLWGGNSQGKTSLAEAMEFLLTGQIARRELLASTKEEFSDSLRNAHIPEVAPVAVSAEVICPDGKVRCLKRTLKEDYKKGSQGCTSTLEIDGLACQESDVQSQLGIKLFPPVK